jgi:phosphate transport system substrate-binding protein
MQSEERMSPASLGAGGLMGTGRLCTVLLAVAACLLTATAANAQIRDPLEVQKGRDVKLHKRGSVSYYSTRWELSDLPAYEPQKQVSGVIRQLGTNYFSDSPLERTWEEGFRKFHPGVRFETDLRTALAAIPALTFGLADIGPCRRITSDETLLFQRYRSYLPTQITVVTGSYNVPGWSYALGVFVHKDNPLARLTIEQLDGIFGAQRSGAFEGTEWKTDVARGPEKNVRTWGQLGLGGEWADKPINVYGYNLRYHIPTTFAERVMQGGAKWNEQLHEFTNYKNADGSTELEAKQVQDAVSRDPFGIGYSSIGLLTPQTKAVAVAPRGSDQYVELNLQSLRSRAYPLYDEVYFYLDRPPGKPLDPKLKEYLRYILSREGQDAVQRDGKYLPLTAAVVQEQLKKLD